ncbi:40S ribosomal protein S4 [Zea mays]|uniref:40S ribosomal protein S4 n=1 Tax=Zea mays TaxID=4577 RepID=A0A3L6G7R1_MAIZE|nr:40S ribosomal protein S4 [Zea mays]
MAGETGKRRWSQLLYMVLLDTMKPSRYAIKILASHYGFKLYHVLKRDILWEHYMSTKLISETCLQLLRRYDHKPESQRAPLLEEFKLCKVRSVQFSQKGIPYLSTYDDRTIRYPDPLIKVNDTIKIDLETNKIMDFIKLYLPFHGLHQAIYLVRLNVSTNS